MTEKLHIVLTFDDNFWAPAYATMRSICVFTKRKTDLVFHLCHRTISAEHKADLLKIETEFGATLVFYDLDKSELFSDIAKRMPVNKRLSNIVYARLVIDKLIDPSIARVLYMDCDMLVRAPIEQVLEIDMQGFPIAAVRDTIGAFITGGRDLARNGEIFDIADLYFNAGLVLIDVAKWRETRLLDRLETLLADGTMAKVYYDQDFLNLVFVNNWLRLPPSWNTIDARHAHEGLDPNLLHYTGEAKPWHLVSNVAFRRLYRHVMTNDLFFRFMRHRWKQYWKKKFGLR